MLLFISGVMLFLWLQICHETQLTDGQKKAAKIKASFGNPFQKVVVCFIVSFIEKNVRRGVQRDARRTTVFVSVFYFAIEKSPQGRIRGHFDSREKPSIHIRNTVFIFRRLFMREICGNAP